MATVQQTPGTWLKHITNLPASQAINQKHMKHLFASFKASVPQATAKDTILKNPEVVFMFREGFGNNRVGIIHHIQSVGGRIGSTESEIFGAVYGLGPQTTPCVQVDISQLSHGGDNTGYNVPTWTSLTGASSAADIRGLQTGSEKYKARAIIPVPPFLLESVQRIIEQRNGDIHEMILTVVQTITAYDTIHSTDTDQEEKAKEACKDLVHWLVLASAQTPPVPAVTTGIITSPTLQATFQELAQRTLGPMKTNSSNQVATTPNTPRTKNMQRVLEALATSAASTNTFIAKLTQTNESLAETKTKGFAKLPDCRQNMILVASSTSNTTPPTDPTVEAAKFFKQPSIQAAEVMLNTMMDTNRCRVLIPTATVTALYHGSFLWANQSAPSGFASSVLENSGILGSDAFQQGIVLDYATKHTMSEVNLAKLTKTQIRYPDTARQTTERLIALQLLAELFFGRDSIIERRLYRLRARCEENPDILEMAHYQDPTFFAKLLCMVDDRINSFFRSCIRAQCLDDTADYLLDLEAIFFQVQSRAFFYSLPPGVKQVTPSTSDEEKDRKTDGPPNPKKQKTEEQERRVPNKSQAKELRMERGEKWSMFQGKLKDVPRLESGEKPCIRYHVKGYCFKDCKMAKTHAPITEKDVENIAEFLNQIRES